MKRSLLIVAYGVGGLLVAIGLTFGAFALAGKDISSPAGHIMIQKGEEVVPIPESTGPSPKAGRSPEKSTAPSEQPDANPEEHDREALETPSPSPTGSGKESPGGSESSGPGGSESSDSHEDEGDD